ncbi:MAG TPA: WD40 repeat domain-containing protein, partial [Bacteroidales bacterium]|nr:WD40 repeat domain-containing protein [Bacteroidales bacterium]
MMWRGARVLFLFLLLLSGSASGASLVHAHAGSGKSLTFIPNQGQWDARVLYRVEHPSATVFIERGSLLIVLSDPDQMDALFGFKYKGMSAAQPRPEDFLIDHFALRIRFDGCNPAHKAEGIGELPHYFNFFSGAEDFRWKGGVPGFGAVRLSGLYPGVDLVVEGEGGVLKYSFVLSPGADPGIIRLSTEPGLRLDRESSGRLKIPTPFGPLFEEAPRAWTQGSEGLRPVECRWVTEKGTAGFRLRGAWSSTDTLVIDPVLSFASYSGSTADNWGYTATYDDQGYLYTGGVAFSAGFPVTTGAYQLNFASGACDIALSKYDTSGGFLIYSTYLGGSGTEVPSSLVVNHSNELVLLGTTGSSNFPVTAQAYDITFNGGTPYTLTSILGFPNGADIILARFSPDGTSLLSSTYFGGSGNEGLNMYTPLRKNYADDVRGEVIVDEQDNILVVSSTSSSNLPVSAGAFQTVHGGDLDAFSASFSRDMAVRIWASYAGGSGKDAGYSITRGTLGQLYLAGGTTSSNLPCASGFQPAYGGGSADGFVYRISPDGQVLQAASYLGSSVYDQSYFVETDAQDQVFLLGQTEASGTTYIHNVSWAQNGGGQFITALTPDLASRLWSTAFGTGGGGPDISPTAFMVDVCGNLYLSGWGGPSLNGFGGTAGLPLSANALYATTDDNDYYLLVLDKDVTQPVFASFYGGSSDEHVDGGTSRFDRRGIIYQAVCAGCGGSDDFPTTTGAWSNLNGSANCNNAVIKLDFNLPLVIGGMDPLASGCVPYSIQFQNLSTG